VLSRLAYLTLCRSIQLLALLARGDAAKDLERHCRIWRPLKPASSTRTPKRHRRWQD
jgi:hypothetical protein